MGYDEMKNRVLDEIKRVFRPEFLNRVDEIMVFHPLSDGQIARIALLMLDVIVRRMREKGIELDFQPEAVSLLARAGFDPQYGARPLRRAIQRMVEDALSEQIVSGALKEGDRVAVGVKDGKLSFGTLKAENDTAENPKVIQQVT